MYEFKYHRPATVRQAANLLVKNEDAKLIAGGHTLVPVMKQRLASPPHLVDLSHVEGLDGIEMKGRSLVIGATAKHADVANSPIVGEAIPALAELAGVMTRLPQVLVNIGGVDKARADSDTELLGAVAVAQAELGDHGRVLLRPSGTEPLVRVMVEAATREQADTIASRLAGVVRERLG